MPYKSALDETILNYLKDLPMVDTEDVVSMCVAVSRRFGIELTLRQGQRYYSAIQS